MRLLVVSSRFPWPPFTGDRLRAQVWLEALRDLGQVTLVAPAGPVDSLPAGVDFEAARWSPTAGGAALWRVLRHNLPRTALLAAPYGWRRALGRVAARGGCDAAVVLLARLDPWVYSLLDAPVKVLDAIAALGANLGERAWAARGPARGFWRREAVRTARLEADAGRRWDRVVVVAEGERAAFGDRAVAVSHGVEMMPLGETARDIDVAFWGRLAYFANADAARFLLDEVWPEVRRLRPVATLLIGGADAPGWLAARHGRDGVTVASPMADREATLRRVKVAVMPVRFGTGQSNKVFEAGEAGCAVVSTGEGVRALDDLRPHVVVEQGGVALGARVAELLADPAHASRLGLELRAAVERGYERGAARRKLAAVVASAVAGEGRGTQE